MLPTTSWGPVTTIASDERLPPGHVTLAYEFAYDGGKPGSDGTGALCVNGKRVACGRIGRTIPCIFGIETADVGVNLYTPVNADYAKGDNGFTGTIKQVRIDVLDPAGASHVCPNPDQFHHPCG